MSSPVPPAVRPPYVYRCVDESILVGPFRRHWVPLFDWWIPRWLHPNFITFGSSACMWVGLACIVNADAFGPVGLALTLAALIHFYVIYDQVDGMHAKKTGASSALGEYLDHSLDVYHGSIAVLMIFAAIGFESRGVVLAMLGCTHLAFAATMVVEKERGELFLGALGSLEGVLLFIAFLLSWTVPSLRLWWQAPLIAGLPAYWLLIVGGGIGAVIGTIDCLRRIGRVPGKFLEFTIAHGVLLAVLARGGVSLWAGIAVAMLHAADYAGRVIGSHLLGQPHPRPDWIAPSAAVVAVVAGGDGAGLFTVGLVAWVALRTLAGVAAVLYALRADWRWLAPAAR